MIFHYPKDAQALDSRFRKRRALYDRGLLANVSAIFQRVEAEGDSHIHRLTQEFDKVKLGALRIPLEAVREQESRVDSALLKQIDTAIGRVRRFNEEIKPPALWRREIEAGIEVGEKHRPLEAVGLWVPSRKAPLLSTAIMLVTAAKVAGVQNISLAVPPYAAVPSATEPSANPPNPEGDSDIHATVGGAHAATLVAAYRAGADSLFVGNGVGIIAGWTLGTQSIPQVQGIFGPGPNAIAAAMALSFSYGVKTVLGIGPTDSAILWDGGGSAQTIAYDLLNEAEHGRDSTSVLITTNKQKAVEVENCTRRILAEAGSAEREILKYSFSEQGASAIVVVDSIERGIEFINDFAPEHLIVNVDDSAGSADVADVAADSAASANSASASDSTALADSATAPDSASTSPLSESQILDRIHNCGEILLGSHTPFSAANYAIGITAVLPTSGYAKNMSGITCRDMMKTTSIGKLSDLGLRRTSETVDMFSHYESLPFHGLALKKRLQKNAHKNGYNIGGT